MNRENKMIVDFYPGAYGPTLIIITKELDELFIIKTFLRELHEGIKEKFSLGDCGEFSISGVDDVVLKLSERNRIRVEKGVLIWEYDKEAWESCWFLVDKLAEGSGGHQYLEIYEDGREDIIIELSYKENLVL